jgi:hypothetical protein
LRWQIGVLGSFIAYNRREGGLKKERKKEEKKGRKASQGVAWSRTKGECGKINEKRLKSTLKMIGFYQLTRSKNKYQLR